MKYENIVEHFCTRNWKDSEIERRGGIGVACVLSFIDGIEPKPDALAKWLGLPVEEVKEPFISLAINGVFGERYNAKSDTALLGKASEFESQLAWTTIAGMASGLVGIK